MNGTEQTKAKTPTLEELSIVCPHIANRPDNASLGNYIADGAMISLGEKHLLLCMACWQVVRARVYDSIVQLAVKHGK